MKPINLITSNALIAALLMMLIPVIFQAQSAAPDKCESPYFFVLTEEDDKSILPLKSTSASVDISGVIADVGITQVYKNESETALEAIYIFPASTRAAIYHMVMTIGERTIIARIAEKEQARQEYEDAREQGQTASLLEQQRPNVFQMNVANIMPGDEIKVEMKYTEMLVPEEGVYSFVYPTVVGPRYSNSKDLADAGNNWVSNPYTEEGIKPLYEFDIDISLNAGMPLKDVGSPSHEIDVQYSGLNAATIGLHEAHKFEGNRDFILKYRLTGDQIQTGILLFEGEDENFFLAMLQPPKRVTKQIVPSREYIFIVDVSGSMHGFPLNISKELMKNLISDLNPQDKFNILLFAGGSKVFENRSVHATPEKVSKAISFINKENGGGGTELLPALQTALAFEKTEGISRTFVIATDGYISVEKEAYDLMRKHLGDANFFTFGIGSSVNRYLLEGMAHVGKGEAFVLTDEKQAEQGATRFRNMIENPVLTDIKVHFEGLDVYDTEPNYIPDIFAERPVIITGKYKGEAQGEIKIEGNSGEGNFMQSLQVKKSARDEQNQALKYLWAREKIRLLDDYCMVSYDNKDMIAEVTNLGLKYNLLTNYTSFVAIDSEIRNSSGVSATVKQPLPLPHGVSNHAVGSGGYVVGGVAAYSKKSVAPKHAAAELMEIDIVEEEVAFMVVEQMPEFKGGEIALESFILSNLHYPEKARNQNLEGTVFIEFVVEDNGLITEVRVVHSTHVIFEKEAIRIVNLMNKMWKPAKQRGKPVRCRMNLPIKFKLS